MKKLLLAVALALPMMTYAKHIDINAIYCAVAPGKGLVKAIQAKVDGEVVFEWTVDPAKPLKENQKDLTALMDKHIKEETNNWKGHPINVHRAVVGKCPKGKRM